jgi:chromosome segregation ATPase
METQLILETLAKSNDKWTPIKGRWTQTRKRRKLTRNDLREKLDSSQEKAEARMAKFEEKVAADRKANQEDLLAKAAKQEKLLAEISSRMDTNMMKMAAIRSESPGKKPQLTPVKGLKKQVRSKIWPQTATRREWIGPGELMDPGESRLSPT